jgi:hypothetical protein
MFNITSSLATRIESVTDTPVAGKVIFEIGVILSAHLAVALVVAALLQAFGES